MAFLIDEQGLVDQMSTLARQVRASARTDTIEECAKIAQRYVDNTNADIAHAILREIRALATPSPTERGET